MTETKMHIEHKNIEIKTFKFVQIQTSWRCRYNFPEGHYVPWHKFIWGIDIWINNFPLLKLFFVANVLATVAIVLFLR